MTHCISKIKRLLSVTREPAQVVVKVLYKDK